MALKGRGFVNHGPTLLGCCLLVVGGGSVVATMGFEHQLAIHSRLPPRLFLKLAGVAWSPSYRPDGATVSRGS